MSVISEAGDALRNAPEMPLKLVELEDILQEAGVTPIPEEEIKIKQPDHTLWLIASWLALIGMVMILYGFFAGLLTPQIFWPVEVTLAGALMVLNWLIHGCMPKTEHLGGDLGDRPDLPLEWLKKAKKIKEVAGARRTYVFFAVERYKNGYVCFRASQPELDTYMYIGEYEQDE